MAIRYGYKASAEQFGPRELLELSAAAERLGVDEVVVSDHFQPWRHSTGHGPNALVWLGALGERTKRVRLGTSVLTPIALHVEEVRRAQVRVAPRVAGIQASRVDAELGVDRVARRTRPRQSGGTDGRHCRSAPPWSRDQHGPAASSDAADVWQIGRQVRRENASGA